MLSSCGKLCVGERYDFPARDHRAPASPTPQPDRAVKQRKGRRGGLFGSGLPFPSLSRGEAVRAAKITSEAHSIAT